MTRMLYSFKVLMTLEYDYSVSAESLEEAMEDAMTGPVLPSDDEDEEGWWHTEGLDVCPRPEIIRVTAEDEAYTPGEVMVDLTKEALALMPQAEAEEKP